MQLTSQELLGLPESLLTTPLPLGDDNLRRPMLTNGGFMVTGLMLEPRIDQHDSLTFGEALDVLSYTNDDGVGYLVAGSQQYLIGDPPQSPDDPAPSVGSQGFVAKYDWTGKMVWQTWYPMEKTSALASLGDGRILAAGRYKDLSQDVPHAALYVVRARIWETDKDGKEVELDFIDLEEDFGDAELDGASILFT